MLPVSRSGGGNSVYFLTAYLSALQLQQLGTPLHGKEVRILEDLTAAGNVILPCLSDLVGILLVVVTLQFRESLKQLACEYDN